MEKQATSTEKITNSDILQYSKEIVTLLEITGLNVYSQIKILKCVIMSIKNPKTLLIE